MNNKKNLQEEDLAATKWTTPWRWLLRESEESLHKERCKAKEEEKVPRGGREQLDNL